MSSKLHQLEISYNAIEDRLILNIYTQDFKEFSLWLTRRVVIALWPGLTKLLGTLEKTPEQTKKVAKQVSKQFQKEQEQKQVGTQKFATKVAKKTLSDNPILVTGIKGKPLDKETVALAFVDSTGKQLEIVANNMILLSLQKLIKEASQKAEWNLDF